jgi:sugar transferase (PEP-CTERM system associated)
MLNFLRVPIRRQQVALLVVDALIMLTSLPLAIAIRGVGPLPTDLPPLTIANIPWIVIDFVRFYTGATTISMVVFLSLFFIFDLYTVRRVVSSARYFLYILFVCGLACFLIPVFYYFMAYWKLSRGQLGLQAIIIALAVFTWRMIFFRFHHRIARRRRVLVVGAGRIARALLEEIHASFQHEIEIVGVLDDDPAKAGFELNGYRVIGGTSDLRRVARETEVETLVFAISRQNNPIDASLMGEILELKTLGIEVVQMPTYFKKITGRVPVEFVESSWLVFNQGFVAVESGPATRVRRLCDILISLGFLVALSPLLLAVALAIKLTSRGPVFYRQERLGLSRRTYAMIKFRSMVVDAEKGKGPVWSAGKQDSRVTAVGRFLRRTRLDEVPNFFNVLKGDMSLVGPRPERAHFADALQREIPYYALRFAVKPGLTGWAQVNYSYGASVEDARRKLQYEMFYIQERSLFLDLVILLKTAQTVLLRPGS